MTIIIKGIRRCGKSTLLEMFQDYLKENGVDEKLVNPLCIKAKGESYLEDVGGVYGFEEYFLKMIGQMM